MSEFTITLPKLGESIVSATIVQWFKKPGDNVSLDEPILEVATDKINSEIPSPVEGKVQKLLVEKDQEVSVGQALAIISTEKGKDSVEKISSDAVPEEQMHPEDQSLLSPAVLKLMQEHKLSFEDIKNIQRTSKSGRLSKKDLLAFLESTKKPEEDQIKMSNMRKAIAENMVKSFYQAPHASLITEIDVTDISQYIQKEKKDFLQKHQAKLSITSFVALAIGKAVKNYPLINSTLKGDTIYLKKEVNLGIAVSVENGIMVPVIKNIGTKDIVTLSKEINAIANRVRSNTLSPDELQNGTLTITNFGMSGVMIGIPIIRHPEMAIIGVGALKKKVAVIDEDKIAIRSLMHLCLTFDHRVIDGMYGCSFLQEIEKMLKEIPLLPV